MASRFLVPYSSTRSWMQDPLFQLQREIDRVFEDVFSGGSNGGSGSAGSRSGSMMNAPRIDLQDSEGELRLHADLPGVQPSDLDIRVEGDVLTIRGERKAESERNEQNFHVMERSHGRFQLSIQSAVRARSRRSRGERARRRARGPDPEARAAGAQPQDRSPRRRIGRRPADDGRGVGRQRRGLVVRRQRIHESRRVGRSRRSHRPGLGRLGLAHAEGRGRKRRGQRQDRERFIERRDGRHGQFDGRGRETLTASA